MDRKNADAGKTSLGLIALAALLWVGLTYVVSAGPAVLIYRATGEPRSVGHVLDVVYAPLEWAYGNTPARRPLKWYIRLWR